jgi:hypothetical protein
MCVRLLDENDAHLADVVCMILERRIGAAAEFIKSRYGLSYQRARTVCHVFLDDGEQTSERLMVLLNEAIK